MSQKSKPVLSNLELITEFAMNNKITHGEFRQIVQALPPNNEITKRQASLDFVISEFATSPKLSPCEFRRLVQVAILQSQSTTSITKKLKAKTGVKGGAISQLLSDLEKKGLLKKIKKGSFKINTNRNEWFPSEMSVAELALQKDLETLEQLKVEILEKFQKATADKQKSKKRKAG